MRPFHENVNIQDDQSILAFDYNAKDFNTPWHVHPQHELTFIVGSIGTKYIGDYVGNYESGELILVSSWTPHCWKNEVNQTANARSTVVQWNDGIYPEVPELSGVFEMLATASRGIAFDKDEIQTLLPTFRDLTGIKGYELYRQLLFVLTELMHIPYRELSSSKFSHPLTLEYSTRMSIIHDFVSSAYSRKIYLKEAAELVNLTEPSFSRFFSKMMGRPFFTFINEYRVNVAARMLVESDQSVSEIGFSCGYESLPFFYKQFSKFKGISPLQFRKKYSLRKLV